MTYRLQQSLLGMGHWTLQPSLWRPYPVHSQHQSGGIQVDNGALQDTSRTLLQSNRALNGERGRIIPSFSGGFGAVYPIPIKKEEEEKKMAITKREDKYCFC